MVAIVALTVFAVLVAQVARAPRPVARAIAGVGVAALVATQLLPAGHPLRADVAESVVNLAWLALALVPVAAYALVLRRLRRRTGVGEAPGPAHPVGLVRIDEDAALAADTGAALGEESAAGLGERARRTSLGWRGEDGALAGHLRLVATLEVAEVEMLMVAPRHRRQGVARRLLAGAETVAREWGARRLAARVGSWQVPEAFAAAGFARVFARPLGGGRSWIWMEKELA
jgi:GNAT superfamily N-acetyltransferase